MAHAIEWLALGVIPWWFYIAASFAVAIGIVIEIPNRMGLILGVLAALVLGDIGWSSKGYHLGAAATEAKWRGWAEEESQRLAKAMQAQRDLEAKRADDAETQNKKLQEEVLNAQALLPPLDGPASGGIIIPPDIARSLRDIGGGRPPGGRPHSAPLGPFNCTGTLCGLLRDDRKGAQP